MIKQIGKREIFKAKLFSVHDVDLQTSDGKKVTFQIIEKQDTALLVPINSKGEVIFIKEYFAAIDSYELSLPKGRVDEGYSALETANKELQEEVGFKAERVTQIATLTMSPGYLTQKTHIFLAQDLRESRLTGDELEAVAVAAYPLSEIELLIAKGELAESRTIAALFLARNVLKSNTA